MSCLFMPYNLVRHFHVLHFHVRHFQSTQKDRHTHIALQAYTLPACIRYVYDTKPKYLGLAIHIILKR